MPVLGISTFKITSKRDFVLCSTLAGCNLGDMQLAGEFAQHGMSFNAYTPGSAALRATAAQLPADIIRTANFAVLFKLLV